MRDRDLFVIFLFSVFLLALIKIENSDVWTHLSIGREIFHLKGLPETEPFTYPMFETPFVSYSWLFALIVYISYYAFNVYGVIILKAAVITLAFYILTKDSLLPCKNYYISLIVMLVIVVMTRPRFVERPDIFLMVFLPYSIYALNSFLMENKKHIYSLPFVHMVWANMHVSINLMFIPFLSFIAGGLMQSFQGKKGVSFQNTPSRAQIKTVILIFTASFALSMINPNFISQYAFGFDIIKTIAGTLTDAVHGIITQNESSGIMPVIGGGQWREIIELQRPSWQINKWPYLISPAVFATFILNWFAVYRARSKGIDKRYPSLIHLLLVMPFIVLSFTAMRFVPLLGLVAGPVLARNLSGSLDALRTGAQDAKGFWGGKFSPVAVAILLLSCTALSAANVRPFYDSRKQFGFGINYDVVPEGALRYMDKRKITGRVFNEFHWGQYIAWRDFPSRLAFVDGRFYLTDVLMEKAKMALVEQSVLDELENAYGFQSLLVGYPLVSPHESRGNVHGNVPYDLSDKFVSHPGWALVYWDDQSLLYLKRGGKYDAVITEDEYRFVKPVRDIHSNIASLQDAGYRNYLIGELKRNVADTGSSKGYAFLGFVYNESARYREAIDAYSRVRDFQPVSHMIQAYVGIAYAYDQLGNPDEAIRYYKKALTIKKDAALFHFIGKKYIKKQDRKSAVKYLEKALETDRELTSVYPVLAGLYRELGMKDEVRKTLKAYETAATASEGEKHFKNGVRAYSSRQLEVAEMEFKRSIEANPSSPAPYSNLAFIYYETGRFDLAFIYHKKAIALNPDFANSYYGLALIYKKQGDMEMGKKHWEEYLRVEPEGFYSKKAREELKFINQAGKGR